MGRVASRSVENANTFVLADPPPPAAAAVVRQSQLERSVKAQICMAFCPKLHNAGPPLPTNMW